MSKKVMLFDKKDEAINVYWPFFFIPLIVYEIFSRASLETFENGKILIKVISLIMQPTFKDIAHISNFFVGFVLLNITHVIFTYVACFELSSFKGFLSEKSKKEKLSVILPLLCLIVFLIYTFVVYYVQTDKILLEKFGHIISIKHLLLITVIFGAFHIRRQTLGFFLMYNQKLRSTYQLTPAESEKVSRLEKIERLLFIPIVWHPILALLALFFEDEALVNLGHIIRFLPMLPAIGLIVISRMYPYANQSNKFLFSLRILLTAFAPYSFVSALLERGHHGVEYYYLIKSFYGKVLGGFTKLFYTVSTVYAFISCFTPYTESLFYLLYEKQSQMGFWMILISSFIPGIHLFHFYVDGIIFKFKDPLVRNHILPLMK